MCDVWNKPTTKLHTSCKCKCGERVIRRDREGVYVPLILKGAALQNVGCKSFEDARKAYEA